MRWRATSGASEGLLDDDPAGAAALYERSVSRRAFGTGPGVRGLGCVRRGRNFSVSPAGPWSERADAAAEAGDLKEALKHAARLVSLDPLREAAQRRLMRLLCRSGDRAGALRQYQACTEVLNRELQIEPDATTIKLFNNIRRDAASRTESNPLPAALDIPPIPDKPSIAVLPFDNLNGDPDQDFFGLGVAEDVITELSRFHLLFVIARGSSFSFRGQSLNTREIAAKLGVRYILEGSVRTLGSRIRITAQLIDAETEKYIWAERYDRELNDTFAVQDEVTNAIVLAIAPQIDRNERKRARRKPPESLDAWAQFQHGLATFRSFTEADLRQATILFDRTTEMDPSFATAYAYAGAARNRLVLNFSPEDSDRLIEEVRQRLDTAFSLDPQDNVALFASGVLEMMQENYELAVNRVEQAIAINPNSAYSYGILGFVLRCAGRPAKAIGAIDQAMRLSPYDPAITMFYANKVNALFELEQYEDCANWGYRAIYLPKPLPSGFISLAAALICLGRCKEASGVMDKLKLQFPDYTIRPRDGAKQRFRPIGWRSQIGILRQAGLAS